MTARKPIVPPMRVGDVARLLDVTIPTIHHWQANFPMPVLRQGGQRRFPQASINRLRLVKQLLRKEGYTIDGARKHYNRLISCNW